jgi:hypothetical protein
MKGVFAFSIVVIVYFLFGFYVSQVDPMVIPEKISREMISKYYDYRGILNVHTRLSIGSGNIQEIVDAAKVAQMDFVVLTDLNTFSSPHQDSYYENLLVLVGGKYSYLDSRLIYLPLDSGTLGANLGESQILLTDHLTSAARDSSRSLLYLAHPYKTGFNWSGEIPLGLDGFELVNTKSLAQRAWELSKPSIFWTFLIYPFNPKLSFVRLFNEPSEEIRLLDELSQTRRIYGYAGAEASARAIPWSNYLLRFPSYEKSFELFSNHVLMTSELTGNLEGDKQKIFAALKNGNHYISFDLIGNPRGFVAVLEKEGDLYLMGSEVKYQEGLELKVSLPQKPLFFHEIVIYRNGERVYTSNDSDVIWKIPEPGAYRVQVRVVLPLPLPDTKKWVTWIYTNPFFVRPDK